MALTKFLARDLKIYISDGASGGDFTEIKGLNTLQHNPSSTNAPTSDFDSAGRAEHLVAERGDEWTLDGYKLLDIVTGDRDPGQLLAELLAQQISFNSIGIFQIVDPGGNTLTFSASAEVTLPGGALNDAAKWACKVTVSGPNTFA